MSLRDLPGRALSDHLQFAGVGTWPSPAHPWGYAHLLAIILQQIVENCVLKDDTHETEAITTGNERIAGGSRRGTCICA